MLTSANRLESSAGSDKGELGPATASFGWTELRPGQEQAVRALVEGRDVVAVMPTGSGKSAIYQVAGAVRGGLTVVVSPLLALQQDQLDGILESGHTAARVSSQESAGRREQILRDAADGAYEYLFLAPEQLVSPSTASLLDALRPVLVAVDEAHCVSAWGHDFRPDYLRLPEVLRQLGRPPVVALTATASPPVRDDIAARLHLREPELVLQALDRPEIRLEVVRYDDANAQQEAIVLRAAAEEKPEIVYCPTRRSTEQVASALAELGFDVATYHAGLAKKEREQAQRDFLDGTASVVVATSAFGMGIDKPDVRTVLHAAIPGSPDNYMQELGRAGRDGKESLALLLYRPADLGLSRFFTGGTPPLEDLADLAARVRDAGTAARAALAGDGLSPRRISGLLNLLIGVGAVRAATRNRVTWTGRDRTPAEVAAEAVELAEQHKAVDSSRVDMMRGYAETRGCRRLYLLAYFGEQLDGPCGNCDRCLSGDELESDAASADTPFEPSTRVVHDTFGEGTVMGVEEGDHLVVLFDEVGYKVLAGELIEREGLLRPAQR